VLEETGSKIKTERSATKVPLTDDDIHILLSMAKRVFIARGQGGRELKPAETELDDLKGRTGKYRAPMLLYGGTLFVGYSPTALDELYMTI